ncbi:hypothetical protein MIMGU_mgv1a021727mg [Erythranthe guttata]|uniref:Uncharacterized protein n=1 Tax=Erythranthe guttata TaxID=4155 RepID=A0A022RPP4_ERYGU|nr:hypothetical protein MIMGU_mgv1a021727mg [Erythranthe guttata]
MAISVEAVSVDKRQTLVFKPVSTSGWVQIMQHLYLCKTYTLASNQKSRQSQTKHAPILHFCAMQKNKIKRNYESALKLLHMLQILVESIQRLIIQNYGITL